MNTAPEMHRKINRKSSQKQQNIISCLLNYLSSSSWSAQAAKTNFSMSLSFSPRTMRKYPCSPHWRPHELATNWQKKNEYQLNSTTQNAI